MGPKTFTSYSEDLTILRRKTATSLGVHVFQQIGPTKCSGQVDDDWTKIVTSTVLSRDNHSLMKKIALPCPDSHVFQSTGTTQSSVIRRINAEAETDAVSLRKLSPINTRCGHTPTHTDVNISSYKYSEYNQSPNKLSHPRPNN
ncbi:hypothetical protein DPMN_030404 [Dreissena polymorpha]|uniref:Uncharacterized protein n=1 Tax=Dreissena polymorpha TaxID=45954 RepID=A0A9D4LYZ3_DREPO|nr:hypothetical protein DPMN_030404 [Dreissena polymorpha]